MNRTGKNLEMHPFLEQPNIYNKYAAGWNMMQVIFEIIPFYFKKSIAIFTKKIKDWRLNYILRPTNPVKTSELCYVLYADVIRFFS